MGPNASLSFTLAGISLLVLRRRPAASQLLAFGMFVLATIALVGYWYGAQELYSVAQYTGIAWPTAVTFLILSIGLIGARDDAGVVAPLVSDGPGALLARRLMLPVGLVPLVLGYIVVVARDADLIDRGLATALFAVTLSILLSVLIWRTALILDAADRARALVAGERDELLVREQRAREAAEHANRLKDEFLATLSHELRTPLNAILGWVELLRSDRVTEERRAHAAGVVARNATFLTRLVEDLLDVSRIAAGQVQLQVGTVDVAKVAHRAVETTSETAKKKGVTVTAALDGSQACTVTADPERLQQIINNLVANAVKFTPPGGLVHVCVTPTNGRVEVVVRDTGRGIGPDFLPHVFDRFRQEDATSTREHGGLGLGLSIARELAQLHGGSITADSAGVGQGAAFTLTLPRS
jgi:signal transduction histidine kinase